MTRTDELPNSIMNVQCALHLNVANNLKEKFTHSEKKAMMLDWWWIDDINIKTRKLQKLQEPPQANEN